MMDDSKDLELAILRARYIKGLVHFSVLQPSTLEPATTHPPAPGLATQAIVPQEK